MPSLASSPGSCTGQAAGKGGKKAPQPFPLRCRHWWGGGGAARGGRAGGAPKALCSPRSCIGKQTKPKQSKSSAFPPIGPVCPQRRRKEQRKRFSETRAARSHRGHVRSAEGPRGGRSPARKIRAVFPSDAFSQMFKTYERRVVKTHII